MLKRHLTAAAAMLLGAISAAQAAAYYIVVPVPSRTGAPPAPGAASVVVALNSLVLPAGKVGVTYTGVSFQPALQVTGDPAFTGAGVSWAVTQGGLPPGISLDSNSGTLAGTPTAATSGAGQSFQVTASYKSKQGSQSYSLVVVSDPHSCKEYLASTPSAASGWYDLDVDGAGPAPRQSYYCDMTSDGGGWTRVVRQTEAQPVTNWNGGVDGASYALASASIPAHTQVAFGKDEQATALDYINGTYSAGDIPKTLVTSPKTGVNYHLHRSASGNYSDHDPESGYGDVVSNWSNTLTLDRVGGAVYTWAFSPKVGDANPAARGYAFNGLHYADADTFAWTVWVR
jgi:hypothetical protein